MPDKRKKVTFVKSKPAGPDGLRKVTKVKKMSEKRAKKKEAKGQGKMFKNYSTNAVRAAVSASDNSGINMGHSPAEMSPLDGHCGPMKMESSKQEKYNLMHDNPVAKHASGGSWMSKHSKSAFQMGHSPAEMGHESPAKMHGGDHGDDKKLDDMKKKTAALNELRRQRGDFGDIPASSLSNPKSLSGSDSKKIADMKRKLKALNELRKQKGHFKKK